MPTPTPDRPLALPLSWADVRDREKAMIWQRLNAGGELETSLEEARRNSLTVAQDPTATGLVPQVARRYLFRAVDLYLALVRLGMPRKPAVENRINAIANRVGLAGQLPP